MNELMSAETLCLHRNAADLCHNENVTDIRKTESFFNGNHKLTSRSLTGRLLHLLSNSFLLLPPRFLVSLDVSGSAVGGHGGSQGERGGLGSVLRDLVKPGDENLREMNKKLQNMLEEQLTKNMHLQKVSHTHTHTHTHMHFLKGVKRPLGV